MKTLSTTLYAVFVLTLLAVAGLFLVSLLRIPGNIEIKIVKSGSMDPAIHTGSIVVIRPEPVYAIGDVITFGEDSRVRIPTTHRVVSVREDGGETLYTTKGDRNEETDPDQIAKSRVIGKVLIAVPYAGYILNFARQPIGFALLIGLPAALIIIDELFAICDEIKNLRARRRVVKKATETPIRPPLLRVRHRYDISPNILDLRRRIQ